LAKFFGQEKDQEDKKLKESKKGKEEGKKGPLKGK